MSCITLQCHNYDGILQMFAASYSCSYTPQREYRVALYRYPRMILHYDDVIMSMMASQITSLPIVYSIVYSAADQRKHQSPSSLAFVLGIHQWPVNSPHKRPVTRKMFPFDDVIMNLEILYLRKFLRTKAIDVGWKHNSSALSYQNICEHDIVCPVP